MLTSALAGGDQTVVTGTLDSQPLTHYRIDLYGSTAAQVDASGNGEGARPLGNVEVVTDAAGHADFTATVSGAPAGDVVTATASRIIVQTLETSEFSRGVAVLSGSGPFVRQVYVRSSAWAPAFQSYLQAQGIGTTKFGYAVPGGAAQLAVLPWPDIDQISIQFSEPFRPLTSDLTVHGVRVANYPVRNNQFGYDTATRTATWILETTIAADRVVLHLEGDGRGGIVSGGRLLDGEWVNGQDAYPSGDGTPGGDFDFRINVLPGDVNQSGAVLADDFSHVKQKFFRSTTNPGEGASAYSAFDDVDGSASILANDFSEVKKRFFDRLPAGEPAATAAAIGAPVTSGARLRLSPVGRELLF